MRAAVERLDDLAGEDGVRTGRLIAQAVGRADRLRAVELIGRVAAAAEAVLLELRKRRILREDGQVEHAGLQDHVMRQVLLVDRDGDALGRVRDLRSGVDDAGVVAFPLAGAQDEQAVGQGEHRLIVHRAGFGGVHLRLRQRGAQGVGQRAQLRALALGHGGAERQLLVEDGDVLQLAEQVAHVLAGRRGPRAVFDEGDGTVLQVVRNDVVQQVLHRDEDARIIRRRGKDEMTPAEGRDDDIGRRGDGDIEHDGLHAALAQADGQQLGRVLRAAVDGGVGDHDALLLRGIGAPVDVAVDEFADVFAPDEAVQGADAVDLNRGGLLEQGLHLRAVFADDVAVIAPRLVHIIAEEVDLIGEQRAVDRAERAEGVSREQRARRQVIADHDLRPVDHRGAQECERVVAGLEGVALLDEMEGVLRGDAAAELLQHGADAVAADDDGLRMAQQHLADRAGMVRLHVVDDEIVELAPGQNVVDVLEEYLADRRIDRVEQDGLVVEQQIGIVGNSVRHGVNTLEHSESAVIPADPPEILQNLADTVHKFFLRI